MIDKLQAYKRKLAAVKQRADVSESAVKQLRAEVARLEDELEVQASQNDNSIMARLGIDGKDRVSGLDLWLLMDRQQNHEYLPI